MQRCRSANKHATGVYVLHDGCYYIVLSESLLESLEYSGLVSVVVQDDKGNSRNEQVAEAVPLDVENYQRPS